MTTDTPEAKELSLVGKVEFRVAMIKDDDKLQDILNTYLPPLLLKLASEHMSVRNKVINVCQHINTRITPPSIKLPVASLLRQYKENHNSLIRHFDLLYIQQGVERLPLRERLDLLPDILHDLETTFAESAAHAAILFNLFLKLLHSMTFPPRGTTDDIELRDRLGLAEKPDDAAFVTRWLGKFLLFSINQSVRFDSTRCPGLSKAEYDFFQMYGKIDTWATKSTEGCNLIETKVLASKFLASGAFLDSERFLPALFASADPNPRISEIGDDMMKRATSAVSFEDPVLIKQLYDVFLGKRGTEGSLPARIQLQTKLLSILSKSKLASSFVPQSIQIVQEALAPVEFARQDGNSTNPKRGLEAMKLRSQVFAFMNWLARISAPADLSAFAPALVGELRAHIETQGWPRYNSFSSAPRAEDLASRAYGYESIGILAGACPEKLLLDPNLDLIRWLFTSLSEDSTGNEVSTSIEQSLSSVLGALDGCSDPEFQLSLTSLLLHHMNLSSEETDSHVVRKTGYVAVRFANRCLPFNNATARLIDVLAMKGDVNERSALLEEGRKGLDPYWFKMLNPTKNISYSSDDHEDIVLPAKTATANGPAVEATCEMTKYRLPYFPELIHTLFGTQSPLNAKITVQTRVTSAYISALTFCRCVLFHLALEEIHRPPVMDADWERNIDALITNDENARSGLKEYFRDLCISTRANQDAPTAVKAYLQAASSVLIAHGNSDVSRAVDYLLELCALSPNSLYINLSANILSLQNLIFSTNKTLRDRSSHMYGILASLQECPKGDRETMQTILVRKSQSWPNAIGSEALKVHGAILAHAYLISRVLARDHAPQGFDDVQANFITLLSNIVNDCRDKMLLDAAFVAISELALVGVLRSGRNNTFLSMTDLVQKLMEKAKEGEERAIAALGHVAIWCDEDQDEGSLLKDVISKLFELNSVRQPEVQFTVGAALSCAAIGWQSKSLIAACDIQGPAPPSPVRNSTLSLILIRVLLDCRNTKPVFRQASVIWLLCLVHYCGHMSDVQSRLRECQVAFKGFLADRDSLNQESASRGLTLVYEKGNKALRDELIRDLVGSFTESKSSIAGMVSEDTELFDPGALPTGDGSITTYKDIMSLASEVGDSSLVYKFMSLASNNAIWSSRVAFGRFGLSNMLSDASMDGHLSQNPKLYSALFRYRFDPNINVRNSMNDIWSALVPEPTKTIDHNFEGIINDLLKSILGKEWRVRQASCAAIADLLQGRQLEKYEKYLTQIWELTFKVCDDIKESVRTAAMGLARVLTGILTRGLEAGEVSAQSSNQMLKQVLPFLLSPAGLESGAPDVQDFARKTLLKIIKSSNGKILRPFVPNLVGRLLALLSSIEPEMINYLHLNAEKYGMTGQQIDDARLKHIRGSSMIEAIERCLDFLDEASMPELQRSLDNAVKTVVGLPSKVGCSRVLASLSTRQNFIFQPYADHFLPLARKQLLDRNDTISSSYATACGYLARLVANEVLLRFLQSCHTLYFESDDERHRMIAGDIIYNIFKHATDRFNSVAADILPFVFVAKHDTYERAKVLFEDTWSENVGGSRAVLLYLREIVDLALRYVGSARWSIKHTSALAIADVVFSSGTRIADAEAQVIWPALEQALGGKTWEGKEIILKALIQYARNSSYWSKDAEVVEQVEKIVLRESKRNNPVFRQHALGCLADFIELSAHKDMYPQVYAVVIPVIEESLGNAEEMDIDSKSGGQSPKSISESILASSVRALLESINPSTIGDDDLASRLRQTMEVIQRVKTEQNSRKTIDAIYDAQNALFTRFDKARRSDLPKSVEEVLIEYIQGLFSTQDQVEQTRLKAAEAIFAAASIARMGEHIKAIITQGLATEDRSAMVQQSLDRAKKVVEGQCGM